jgi:hypothetical protein
MIVQAIEYPVYTITDCVGDINVKVQSVYNDSYSLVGCTLGDKYWNCACNNSAIIKISFDKNTESAFDFTVFYYVDDISKMSDLEKSNAERKKVLSGVVFREEKENQPSIIPNKNIVIIIIVVAVLIGLVGMFFVGKYLFKKIMQDDKNE